MRHRLCKPPAVCSTSTVEPHQSEFTSHHSSLLSSSQGGGSYQAGWAGCRKALDCMIIKTSPFLNTTRGLSLGSSAAAHTNTVGLCVCVCRSSNKTSCRGCKGSCQWFDTELSFKKKSCPSHCSVFKVEVENLSNSTLNRKWEQNPQITRHFLNV